MALPPVHENLVEPAKRAQRAGRGTAGYGVVGGGFVAFVSTTSYFASGHALPELPLAAGGVVVALLCVVRIAQRRRR